MSQNLSSAAVLNGGERVNTDLLMLYPSFSCFLIIALMTMVMKNSADAQPDQNYGATLFIKVGNISDKYNFIVTVFSSKIIPNYTFFQNCSNNSALLNKMAT